MNARKSIPTIETPLVASNAFRKTVLPNGLTIVSEFLPNTFSAALGFWIKSGSRNEPPAINGISHLIEHMAFKGTSKRSAFDIASEIENVGGVLNAYTSKELTCYYAYTLHEHLLLAADVLTDILTNQVFSPLELAKEKDVIFEEIRSVLEAPEERIHDYFHLHLFENHPFSYPIMGSEATLRSIDRAALVEFFQQNYTLDRLVIAAAGCVDHNELCDYFSEKFEHWSPKADAPSFQEPSRPRQKQETYVEDIQQGHFCVGTVALSFSDPLRYAAYVLNTIVGGCMSSRLFQTLREEHALCYNVYSDFELFDDAGIFFVYGATDSGKLDLATDLVFEEFEKLKADSITEEELYRTKTQLRGGLLLGLEGASNRMNWHAKREIYNETFIPPEESIRQIEKLTIEDIERVASLVFDPKHMVVTRLKAK